MINRPSSLYACKSFAVLLVLLLPALATAQTDTEPASVSLVEAAQRGPAVASALEMPRDTPAQRLKVMFTLFDLGQEDVAQVIWQELENAEIEEAEKAALVRQLGPARFLRLARRESAEGMNGARAFAESCLQAAAQLNRNPERLAKLVSDLGSPNVEVRQAARSDLAVTGDAGAIACLEALAQAQEKQLRTELMLTLAKMRPAVEPMLVAALADGQGQFRRDMVELTGYLHLQSAVPWLAAITTGADDNAEVVSAAAQALSKFGLSVPSESETRALIRREIRRLEAGHVQHEIDDAWWAWQQAQPNANQSSGKLISGIYPAEMINNLAIHRLASILVSVGTPNKEDQQTEQIYYFETLPGNGGAASTRDLSEFSIQGISNTLAAAIQRDRLRAATSLMRILGQRADVEALQSIHGLRSPLAAALVHADRELRYTALETIMQIKPERSFAGASGVSKALWSFAAGAGDPQAIAASSVVAQASDWAGELRGLGYDATPVTTGREALRTALSSPRLDLILVDSDIGRPLMREVIYQLRSTPQTERVPIAVLSSMHNLSRAQRLAEQDRWLLAIPRPHGEEAMQSVVERLVELDPGRANAERRTEQAVAALGWLAELLETGHPYDEVLRDASLISKTLYNTDLTEASLRVLAVLGTAESQRLLVDVVSAPTLPIETRQAAVKAFANSVQRSGKLLNSQEILRQYDRYNASETAKRDTQEVLGEVLDILEKQK